MQDTLFEIEQPTSVDWTPTVAAAEARLKAFAPRAGKAYAGQRNFDFGPEDRSNVSALSPWLRHRVITEEAVLAETLQHHSPAGAEKFIQEVFWRAYFKGWLEHRPSIWSEYRAALVEQTQRYEKNAGLARAYDEAVTGRTGIACFDSWARELVETGYLHNHARMWFASIWIFTLKLPWELGADFFYRHLMDGDAASNTCSWRWVGGRHTIGKTYLARASNIEKFSAGRFNPAGQLAPEAPPLTGPDLPQPVAPDLLPTAELEGLIAGQKTGLLISEEDCAIDWLPQYIHPEGILGLAAPTQRSVWELGTHAKAFTASAVETATRRAGDALSVSASVSQEDDWSTAVVDWAREAGVDTVLVSRPPIGPARKRLKAAMKTLSANGVDLIEVARDYDCLAWPHAKKGFFGLKKKIPSLLDALGL